MSGSHKPEDIITWLGLQPHPEGGWYRETFRDVPNADGRSASTAIYFLLTEEQSSHWHRVTDAVEIWHFHAGDPLELFIAPAAGGAVRTVVLGPDIGLGHQPQGIVAAGDWQAARSLGAWTLVGCTVAPGFEFAKFEMAPPSWTP